MTGRDDEDELSGLVEVEEYELGAALLVVDKLSEVGNALSVDAEVIVKVVDSEFV